MAYMTSAQLKNYDTQQVIRMAEGHVATKAMADSLGTVVFLSHSHEDKDHVDAARRLLEYFGATIYVDWQDGEMPQTTSVETATKIKKKILECKRFVLLASERSLASKWVPWELGYAEGKKGTPSIAVLPFIASGYSWRGSEYVGLYSTIERSNSDGTTILNNQGTPASLSTWLK